MEPADYYSHLEKTHGPLRWTTTVHSAMPYGGVTEDLEMEATGTRLLVVRRIMHSHDGRPLEYTEIQAPGDRFEAAATVEGDADADGYVALRI
ncbi:UTRA domain-containing protein [Nonomuraea lactucae]|uniref:UTRA domain-containing protein n=1 Tax=Nonomuraea lactucae TaxID=2249762 RepID=UPI0023DCEC05|nr:UTRA domain-containing protein [Nonomuraea lactucae]